MKDLKSIYDLLEVAKVKPKKAKEKVEIFNAGQTRDVKKLDRNEDTR